jgi:hypothetical protein
MTLTWAMIFFLSDPKNTGSKSKNTQMRLHQTKKLLHSKGNNPHSEETTYGMEEKYLQTKHLIRDGLFKVDKKLKQLNSKKTNDLILFEMGKRPE